MYIYQEVILRYQQLSAYRNSGPRVGFREIRVDSMHSDAVRRP